MASRRDFLAYAAALWQQALLTAQQDVNAVQQQIRQQKQSPAAELKQPTYHYAFLTGDEQTLVRRLADRIIPADERSGGAAKAHVEEYIDFILSHAPRPLQTLWRDGLARYAQATVGKEGEALDATLRRFARNEFAPRTADERFFVLLKGAVVEGFYTSEEGITKELRYVGLGHLHEFPGCTHGSHPVPADYQPRLKS